METEKLVEKAKVMVATSSAAEQVALIERYNGMLRSQGRRMTAMALFASIGAIAVPHVAAHLGRQKTPLTRGGGTTGGGRGCPAVSGERLRKLKACCPAKTYRKAAA